MFQWLEKRIFQSFEQRGMFHDLVMRAHREANVKFYGHEKVNNDILSLPPVFRAVHFLSSTLASIPLQVHNQNDYTVIEGDPAGTVLSFQPALGRTSYDWRYAMWKKVFTYGRAITYIERSNGRLKRLHWDIRPEDVKIRVNDRGDWEYVWGGDAKRKEVVWPANRVIDIAWMMHDDDQFSCMSPTAYFLDTMMQAMDYRDFRTRLAKTGGHMPIGVKHRWGKKEAVNTLQEDLMANLRGAFSTGALAVPLPKEAETVNLGMTPRETQMMESQQFIIREVARIWGVPPIYLYDTDRQTFANAEHQGISFVNYTLRSWIVQLEQQLSLKVAGTGRMVRHDMDDLLRGDYLTRVQGHSTAIFSGQLKPNEARRKEDLSPDDEGDELFIQSGTVPISMLKEQMGSQVNNPPSGEGDE